MSVNIDALESIFDASQEVIDFTVDGECSNCGACCSNYLPISAEEIKTIKAYIREHGITPAVNGVPLNAKINMTCPFMDGSKELKCKIYPVRPKICRFFACNKTPNFEEILQMADLVPVKMRETFFGDRK